MRASAVCSIAILVAASFGCGDDPGPVPLEPTYDNVEAVLTRSCTFSIACHGGPGSGQANLNFTATEDMTTVLSGVSACQYDRMPRVDPEHPESSWLMVKIDGTHDEMGTIQFTPDADWPPPAGSDCEDFGVLMPLGIGAPSPLAMDEVDMIREWIRLGAPGPS